MLEQRDQLCAFGGGGQYLDARAVAARSPFPGIDGKLTKRRFRKQQVIARLDARVKVQA
ncbi:hypothetical protein [Paraburkholderia sp. SOS3]|jgi:hypothetical protein|uniref:hypothetical protein n=1 Tax=Paraburkholderia sp. SOS3 TaxID=1926494 RepID=UPI0012EB1F70|nr:hypothetical protein [Paraburkholderia sp. SOS3]